MAQHVVDLSLEELSLVAGGMNLNGVPPTTHAQDLTLGGYIATYGLIVGPQVWLAVHGMPR